MDSSQANSQLVMLLPDLSTTDPRRLARMMEAGPGQRAWELDELGAIFRHQLTAPIDFDLASLGARAMTTLRSHATAGGAAPRTFAELFHDPQPPLDLLVLTKQFAKTSRADEESGLPAAVATVLYLASIVVARLRCGQRITGQSDEALAFGVQWVLDQPWVDERTRALFREGQQELAQKK